MPIGPIRLSQLPFPGIPHPSVSGMKSALWNNAIIAESATTQVCENNQYFPPTAIKKEYFRPSTKTTYCGWKGTAKYYDVEVNGKVNKDAAWYYDQPKEAAENIKDHVAFWRGVEVKINK